MKPTRRQRMRRRAPKSSAATKSAAATMPNTRAKPSKRACARGTTKVDALGRRFRFDALGRPAYLPSIANPHTASAERSPCPGESRTSASEKAAEAAARDVVAGRDVRIAPVGSANGDCDGSCSEASGEAAARRGRGDPLEPGPRAVLEARFGTALDAVRVHRDEIADRLCQTVGGIAFTFGQDIFVARNVTLDLHLLAHEVAHTIQQREGKPRIQRGGKPRFQPRTVAGCGGPQDEVSDDDRLAVGRAAHDQIQEFYRKKSLRDEVFIPRGTKTQMGQKCPPVKTTEGWADLWFDDGATHLEVGEIKPVSMKKSRRAAQEADHYLDRVLEWWDRMRGVDCGGDSDNTADRHFDASYGHYDQRDELTVWGLDRIIPKTPAKQRIGSFDADKTKLLWVQLDPGGAVHYWCTKNKDDEDEKDPADSVAFDQVKSQDERQSAQDYDDQADEPPSVIDLGAAARTLALLFSGGVGMYTAAHIGRSLAASTVFRSLVAVGAGGGGTGGASISLGATAGTAARGAQLLSLGARAGIIGFAAAITVLVFGVVAVYTYSSIYEGTRGWKLQRVYRRLSAVFERLGYEVAAAEEAVGVLAMADSAGQRQWLFDVLYQVRQTVYSASTELASAASKFSAIRDELDPYLSGDRERARFSLELADDAIRTGSTSYTDVTMLHMHLMDYVDWLAGQMGRLVNNSRRVVSRDIKNWLHRRR